MAYLRKRREVSGSGSALFLRGQDDGLILSNDIAQEITNMYGLEEGTLRTVWGPATYVPAKFDVEGLESGIEGFAGGPAGVAGEQPRSATDFAYVTDTVSPTDLSVCNPTIPVYGKLQHGIHHALLQNGERDVLLLHTGNELWEFRGWKRDWRRLLSNPAGPHGLKAELEDDDSARFPTQFETMGNGVVIVPQEGRAYFYNGHIIAPLGFAQKPASPQCLGPEDSVGGVNLSGDVSGTNDTGYTHTGLWACKDQFNPSGMEYGFGKSRIGTVNDYIADSGNAPFKEGLLDSGEWRARVQYIDVFGNLSAASEPSAPVACTRQGAVIEIRNKAPISTPESAPSMSPEHLKFQLAWTGIPTGPDHCVARNLYRTKDLINSGDGNYYTVPQNTAATFSTFATLQDNVSTMYPDNMSDGYLGSKMMDIVPVPLFRLCRAAFGRLFIANELDNEGLIRFSQPGAWGTFQAGDTIFPDATGGEITGMWRCDRGLLAFTSSSTFLITALGRGDDFSAAPLSQEVGCAAPNSIQTLGDGSVVWLGYNGFYAFDGQTISFVSTPLNRLFKRLTLSRFSQACSAYDSHTGEYRCWVSTDGSKENNLCLVFSGGNWRTRTDFSPRDVCTTDDHRGYMLAAGSIPGQSGRDGVYLVDHPPSREDAAIRTIADSREAVIETVWMEGINSKKKETIPTVYLWFRETENAAVNIEVMRDWREDVVETVQVARYSTVDPPPLWGDAALGEPEAKFRRRRPYWTRAQIYLPSAEVVKLRIRGTGFWEFVGLSFDASPRTFGNAQLPTR
jgi:hypothetical protein